MYYKFLVYYDLPHSVRADRSQRRYQSSHGPRSSVAASWYEYSGSQS